MRISDWSSDVCSSDLATQGGKHVLIEIRPVTARLEEVGPTAQHLVPGVTGDRHEGSIHVHDQAVRVRHQHPFARAIEDRGCLAQTLAIGRSEEHTSELQSLMRISYAVFCLKQKKKKQIQQT